MHFDGRCLINPQHPVIREVGLFDAAVLDRDLAIKRCGDAEDNASLDLRFNGVRIDHHAAIHHADHAVHGHFTVAVHGHIDHHAEEAAERVHDRYPTSLALWWRVAPAGFTGGDVEHVLRARCLA